MNGERKCRKLSTKNQERRHGKLGRKERGRARKSKDREAAPEKQLRGEAGKKEERKKQKAK